MTDKKWMAKLQLVLFGLCLCLLLLGVAETGVRVLGLHTSSISNLGLPEEQVGLMRSDPALIWGWQPGRKINYEGAQVTINALGLRGPEILPKEEHEYRILCIGESSTFGVGVNDHETYTARLPALLENHLPNKQIRSINAGVSAYSSFQGRKYLELHGLQLQPDMVIIYHELNDYLPSSVRDQGHNEVGILKTDQQLYESRGDSLRRSLISKSALVRFIRGWAARRKIDQFNQASFTNPLTTIGLPDIGLPARIAKKVDGENTVLNYNESALGRRVSDEERLHNLHEFKRICQEQDILLVVMHPAYRSTVAHECALTRFCAEEGVLVFDAFPALHQGTPSGDAVFHDSFHPNKKGHEKLAEGLATFLAEHL